MIREAYVSDNPWRLLGLGSAVSYKTLRPKAEALFDTIRTGEHPEVPLSEWFGDESVNALPGLVRSLAADPVKRTMCRLLWPFDARLIPALQGRETSELKLPMFARTQADFLEAWFRFLQEGKADDCKIAFKEWSVLCEDHEVEALLQKLLIEEDALSESRSFDSVVQAFEETTKQLCRRAFAAAQSWMSEGVSENGVAIVEEVLRTPVDRRLIAATITPVVQAGEELSARVDSLPVPDVKSDALHVPVRMPDVVMLERLMRAIDANSSATEGWRRDVRRYNDELAKRIIDEAQHRRKRGVPVPDMDGLFASLLKFDLSPELETRIRRDLLGKSSPSAATASIPSPPIAAPTAAPTAVVKPVLRLETAQSAAPVLDKPKVAGRVPAYLWFFVFLVALGAIGMNTWLHRPNTQPIAEHYSPPKVSVARKVSIPFGAPQWNKRRGIPYVAALFTKPTTKPKKALKSRLKPRTSSGAKALKVLTGDRVTLLKQSVSLKAEIATLTSKIAAADLILRKSEAALADQRSQLEEVGPGDTPAHLNHLAFGLVAYHRAWAVYQRDAAVQYKRLVLLQKRLATLADVTTGLDSTTLSAPH